ATAQTPAEEGQIVQRAGGSPVRPGLRHPVAAEAIIVPRDDQVTCAHLKDPLWPQGRPWVHLSKRKIFATPPTRSSLTDNHTIRSRGTLSTSAIFFKTAVVPFLRPLSKSEM